MRAWKVPEIAPTRPWPRHKLANLAAVFEDIAAGSPVLRGMPPVIGLHTSELCNMRCVMCVRGVEKGTRKLDRDLLQRVCDDTFPAAIKAYVTGSNGEPLMGDFDVVLAAALRHGVLLDMATNGSLLTVERYREMRDALQRVTVSLDAHVPEVYAHIRRGGRFDVVMANLRAIAKERRRRPDQVHFDLGAILMRSNAAILPDLIRFAAELGVDCVHVQALRHFTRQCHDEELADAVGARVAADGAGGRSVHTASTALDPGVATVLDRIAEAALTHGVNVTFGDHLRLPVVVRRVPSRIDGLAPPTGICWSSMLNFAIQHDGSVYPCCHPTDYRLGSVVTQTIAEIWNGPVARDLRNAHYEARRIGFCTGCIEAPYLVGQSATGPADDRRRLERQHRAGLGNAPAAITDSGPSSRSRQLRSAQPNAGS